MQGAFHMPRLTESFVRCIMNLYVHKHFLPNRAFHTINGGFNMRIRFSADSTCDMSAAFIDRYQVKVVPLSVELEGKLYRDGVDLTPDVIIDRVNQGAALPKTSAINVAEYEQVFDELLKDCDAVIHFNISSDFSSCYQNACIAAEDKPVYCVDSRNLSSGIALVLAEAADLVEAGKTPEEIMAEIPAICDKVDASFIVDRLDYLYKGGRCSMVAMLGANVLHLRPCIEVKEGKMSVGKKYRGTYERCARQYLQDRMKEKNLFSTRRVYITHTGLADEALESIRKIVSDTIPFAKVYETRAGCSITSHCGDNTFGILMVRK